jgi:hypothetical protein
MLTTPLYYVLPMTKSVKCFRSTPSTNRPLDRNWTKQNVKVSGPGPGAFALTRQSPFNGPLIPSKL